MPVFRAADARLATMIAGGMTEAGLWQSGALMSNLKTACFIQAFFKAMLCAQLLSSVIRAYLFSAID